jgi:ribosomal protein S6--L-glutamate ligase
MEQSHFVIGWKEWASLDDIGIFAIKVKVDTGAKTSSLHAYDIKYFTKDGKKYINFNVHPIQRNKKILVPCTAELIACKKVKSSSGHKEKRPIIKVPIKIGDNIWDIEINLTNRDNMGYRMLLGRQAMVQKNIIIDPSMEYVHKKMLTSQAKKLYTNSIEQ